MSKFRDPSTGGVYDVPDQLDGHYEARGWEKYAAPDEAAEEAAELKGQALDEALREAGLSTSGKAAEKRDRLAAALSGAQQSDETTSGTAATDVTEEV